jgi:hypothetical protein
MMLGAPEPVRGKFVGLLTTVNMETRANATVGE